MSLLVKTAHTRHMEIEGLRLALVHTLYEHHGIPKHERTTYNQLEPEIALNALAPVVAAMLIVTQQPDEAGEQFMGAVHHHVTRMRRRARALPILGGRQ